LVVQTALTKKLSFVEYSDDSFLAMLRHNGDLHATFLNKEDRIRDLTLNEDVLIFLIFCRGSSSPYCTSNLWGSFLGEGVG
jgi:hypothetical protein